MKNIFFRYIVLTVLLIAFNSSYSWAEAFKGGPSDNEMKVLYFLLLSMIILGGTTFTLFFATIAKSIYREDSNNAHYYYLFTTSIMMLIITILFSGATFYPLLIIGVFSLFGILIYKSNPPEANIGRWFIQSLFITIISGVISFVVILSTIF